MNDATFKIVKAAVIAVASVVAKGLAEMICDNTKKKLDDKHKKES